MGRDLVCRPETEQVSASTMSQVADQHKAQYIRNRDMDEDNWMGKKNKGVKSEGAVRVNECTIYMGRDMENR